jgi:hypothetical protein
MIGSCRFPTRASKKFTLEVASALQQGLISMAPELLQHPAHVEAAYRDPARSAGQAQDRVDILLLRCSEPCAQAQHQCSGGRDHLLSAATNISFERTSSG